MDSDLGDFFAYASIPIVGEMAGWKHSATLDEARVIQRSDWFRNECLALYHLADKKVIGSLGLHKSWAADDARFRRLVSADIGYVLHPDYWGRGLAHEAATAVMTYAFAHMDVVLMTCAHFTTNPRSQRVIEKCGFVYDHSADVFAEQLDMRFVEKRYIMEAIVNGYKITPTASY